MGWPEHRYGSMVQEWQVARARKLFAKRRRERALLRSREDAISLQAEVRQAFREIFGPWPDRTPLNARVTGRIEADGYSVEKVLLESRPSFLVSANLYIPAALRAPAPAVLGACGHAEEGKAYDVYQAFAQGLALKGFVVMMFDPVGQGERIQYPTADGKTSLGLCAEHNMVGGQLALAGQWMGAWMTWDGIRCIDYLLGRPEVDPARLGVTGNSGGGTQTGWLCANDDRIAMAAPGCWVTSVLRNIENELPVDIEQVPPGLLERGLDLCDCFVPFAPRPLIILAQEQDFFDARGVREAFEELRCFYRLLGAEGNVSLHVGPGTHGYTADLREAMYEHFTRHAGLSAPAAEPAVVARPEQDLYAAERGSVRNSGSVLLHDLLRPAAVAMRSGRKRVPAKRLPRTLARLLALPPRSGAPGYRVLRRSREGAETWQGFAVETDPGILAIVTMVCSADQQFAVPCERECVLLVPHLHSGEDLKNPGLRARLAGTGRLFAVDPRGIGQSMPLGCDGGEFLAHYDADYHFNSLGVMLREPYQGRRVFDVLSTLDWLRSFGYEDIHLAGRGLGAVTALFAAVVDGGLRRVTLVNCLRSYLELTEVHKQRWPHSAMVNGILKVTDLPECLAALGDRVTMVDPWDSQMNPVSPAQG